MLVCLWELPSHSLPAIMGEVALFCVATSARCPLPVARRRPPPAVPASTHTIACARVFLWLALACCAGPADPVVAWSPSKGPRPQGCRLCRSHAPRAGARRSLATLPPRPPLLPASSSVPAGRSGSPRAPIEWLANQSHLHPCPGVFRLAPLSALRRVCHPIEPDADPSTRVPSLPWTPQHARGGPTWCSAPSPEVSALPSPLAPPHRGSTRQCNALPHTPTRPSA